jgi:hypothetical protein
MDMALDKNSGDVWVKTTSKEQCCKFKGLSANDARGVNNGQGM